MTPLSRCFAPAAHSALRCGLALAALCLITSVRSTPAELDLSFRGTGWMSPLTSSSAAMGMEIQPDGKVLVIGRNYLEPPGQDVLTVWRFHPDGSADTSFNGTGRFSLPDSLWITYGYSLALRSDGRILAGGQYYVSGEGVSAPRSLLVSLLPDGRLDPAFGPNGEGWFLTDLPNLAYKVALQPDGRILAGSLGLASVTVARRLPDGSPDPSFSGGGAVSLPLHSGLAGRMNLALQTDGKVVTCHEDSYFRITRLLPDGTLDGTFGAGGSVSLFQEQDSGAVCSFVKVLDDGKILGGGHISRSVPGGPAMLVARFLPDGSPDPAFGDPATPGRSLLPAIGSHSPMAAMNVQSDGRILVTSAFQGGVGSVVIGRFTAAGRPDDAFGPGGLLVTDLSGGDETIFSAALLADQRLFVGGIVDLPGQNEPGRLLLARYRVPGSVSLSIEAPAGLDILPLPFAALDFGAVATATRVIQVTLRNTGLNPLTNLQAVLTDEATPGEYQITAPATATLAPGDTTTLTVTFTPSAAGQRTASLRFTADAAPPLPPRVIPLTGHKATPQEIWRITWFGSPDNSGSGADGYDFDRDGLPNFLEYALHTSPHAFTPSPCRPVPNTPGVFTYTRPSAALTEFSWQPESAPSPAGPWSTAGLASAVLMDNGTVQTVQITSPATPSAARLFLRLRVTRL